MTKITQYTELKEEMEIKINEMILIIHEIETIPGFTSFHERDRLTLWRDVDGYDTFVVVKRKFLIENNAELIDDNAKVVVSAEVAEILNSAKKQCQGNIVSFMCRVNANIRRTDWIEYYGLTDEVLIAAYKNDWEVEKPKHWEAKEGEIVWFVGVDGIVSNLIVNAFTRQVISVLYESKNHFQTKEEAEAKVEFIRAALRGEG